LDETLRFQLGREETALHFAAFTHISRHTDAPASGTFCLCLILPEFEAIPHVSLVPSGANLSKHYAGFCVSMSEYLTDIEALTEVKLSDS
jgi:hypothetical protein